MKIKLFLQRLSSLVFLSVGATFYLTQLSSAQSEPSTVYFCGSSDGLPTTMYQTGTYPETPLIRWKYDGFGNWSPQRRCEEVARRFQQFDKEGALEFVTSGVVNRLPVVCAVSQQGEVCNDQQNSDRVLFTLEQGRNPNDAIQAIFNVAGILDNNDPRSMINGRLYIDFDKLIDRNRFLYRN